MLKTDNSLTVGSVLTATGGTAGTPTLVTTDTWHSLSPGNSWTGTFNYTLTPHNTARLSFNLNAPAASVNGVAIVTLPVGYRPPTQHQFPVGATSVNSPATGVAAVSTAGVLTTSGIGASATRVAAEVEIPLDV